jgi:curved DNA-binding protein CbpA
VSGERNRNEALVHLGLGPGADEEEIKIAYRRLAMRYHPDASGDPGTARRFAKVVRAYKTLSVADRGDERPRKPRYRSVEDAGQDLFALGQVVASDPEAGARAQAARALGLSGRSSAFVFLRRALYDKSDEVAIEAVRAVAILGSRQAEGEIAALYSRSAAEQRRRILDVARGTGESLFRATVEAASRDEDLSLRALASSLRASLRASLRTGL